METGDEAKKVRISIVRQKQFYSKFLTFQEQEGYGTVSHGASFGARG